MTEKQIPMSQQIAFKLMEMGEATSMQIAMALNMSSDAVSYTLRQRRKQYGVSVLRSEVLPGSGNAHKKNVWTIDAGVFNAYLANMATQPRTAKKMGRPRKVEPPREFPQYTGPHRTVWQACSPYFQGACA